MRTTERKRGVREARAAWLGLLLLLCGLACGQGTSEVTGTVTFQKKKLTSGTVMLMARDGKPYYGQIDSDGTYTIPNVPLGQAKVGVTCLAPPEKAGKAGGEKKPLGKGSGRIQPRDPDSNPKTSLIPERYGDVSSSKLEVEVTSGVTTYDIHLKNVSPENK